MPTVQLYPYEERGIRIPTPDGGEIHFRQRRIRLWVKVGNDYVIHQGVLDTGAPVCIFPSYAWTTLHDRGQIEWVAHPPSGSPRTALPRVTVLGGMYPFRLGRVSLQVVGAEVGMELSPVFVQVQCIEDVKVIPSDPEPLPRLLIVGLEGILNGRTLSVSASPDGKVWSASLSE